MKSLIFSSAVFEHFAMPWQVSIEMIKLLKEGGYLFIETHYSYSGHERPWHFSSSVKTRWTCFSLKSLECNALR